MTLCLSPNMTILTFSLKKFISYFRLCISITHVNLPWVDLVICIESEKKNFRQISNSGLRHCLVNRHATSHMLPTYIIWRQQGRRLNVPTDLCSLRFAKKIPPSCDFRHEFVHSVDRTVFLGLYQGTLHHKGQNFVVVAAGRSGQ